MKNRLNIALKFLLIALVFALSFSGVACAQVWEDSVELFSGDTANYLSRNHPLKKIVVGDPDMVHVDVISKDQIILVGRKMGQSKILLKDDQENTTSLTVFVSPDVSLLKRRIHQLFPSQDIKIYSNANGVILGGTVTGAEIVEQVLRVTQQVLAQPTGTGPNPISVDQSVQKAASKEELATVIAQKQSISAKTGEKGEGGGSGTGKSSPAILNMMTISGPQQVLLEVKFAEVTRQSGRDLQAGFKLGKLGNDFSGSFGVNPSGVTGGIGDLLVNFAGIGTVANLFVNIDNFSLALQFLEEESLARILAEPRLVTQSGQEASFLAGGEYPYQEIDDDGNVSLKFKEFGVGLKFTPIVGSDGLITLHVVPSVTDIGQLVDTTSGKQPILSTRKLESTVHLRDGQTLALAGLLSDNLSENITKIPFLGDLPILGTLFRSSGYQQNKTDLLIAVTPHIVKPLREGEVSYPGEFVKPPSRFEFYLEGRLEGRRSADDPSILKQHSFATSAGIDGGGLEGDFGHSETATK